MGRFFHVEGAAAYELLHDALDDAYDIDHMVLGRDTDIKIDEDVWDKAMKHIYECGKYDPDMLGDEAIEALIRATYDTLMEGVNKGIQTKVTPEFRSALEENTFIFSGFKTHQELKEANDLLMGEYGGLKPYGQFAQDVRKIHENYNELYLRAEYRFAQQSATMASKWASWERRGVEMLQYRTAADDHVRPEHAALDGITRPRTDKFWDTMMPPNGWRCRCTVVPVDAADATETPADVAQRAAESVNRKPKQKIFNFNPGKVGKVFPPKHPYLPKGCGDCDKKLGLGWRPDREYCRVCTRIKKCYQEEEHNAAIKISTPTLAQKKEVYSRPISAQFEEVYKTENGSVKSHVLKSREAADYGRVFDAAKLYADDRNNVLMMSEIHASETDVRSRLGLPDKFSNPDLNVSGKWIDVKSPFCIGNVVSNAIKASKQGAIACITDDHCIINTEKLDNYARMIMSNEKYQQNEVHFIVDGKLYKYNSRK